MAEETLGAPTSFERKLEYAGVVLGVLIWLAIEILLYPWSLHRVIGVLCTFLGAVTGYCVGYFPTTMLRRWRLRFETSVESTET